MIPITPGQLRERVRGWPLADLQAAVGLPLPTPDPGLAELIAPWLASDDQEPGPLLTPAQVAAVWQALQRRGQ